MAIKTFTWNVERDVTPTIQYRVVTAQFGDGYKQESADGINTKDESYAITTNAREPVAKEIMAFFDELKGVKSFLWKPPLGELGLYKCTDPKAVPQGGGLYVITGTFERAFSSVGV